MRLLVIAVVALAAAGGRPRPRAAVEAGMGDGMGEDAERAGGDESDYDDKEEGSTSLAWSNMLSPTAGLKQTYGLMRATMSYLTLFWQAHVAATGLRLGGFGAPVWKWLSAADMAKGIAG